MRLLDDLAREVRYAARTFRREPAFVAGVVLTLGLVIGTNAAMFGLVERLMLAAPPGIVDAARVVRVGLTYREDGGGTFTMTTTSYPAFRAVASLGSAFRAVAAVQSDSMTTGQGGDLAPVAAVQASGNYFVTVGVKPTLGRFFGPADDELPAGNDVVVLSHAFWQRRNAGAPDVVGQQLLVNGQLLTIVGVAPRGFNGTELAATDIFVPMTTAFRNRGAGWWSEPRIRMLEIVARLADGITASNASALTMVALREALGSAELSAVPLESLIPGPSARQTPQARVALWLSGVSLVVLLIATANVGTLLVLRAAKRRRDVAVRLTLGATQGQLARQLVVESMLLALAGCVLGLVLSRWLADIVRVTLLPNVAATDRVVDPRVLAVSVAAACAAGLLAALGPLAQLGKRDLSAELRSGSGHGSSGRFLFQHGLLAFQVALSMVLVIGAGLFVQSLRRVQSQDLGFSTSRLLHVELDFRGALTGPERDHAHEDAMRRIASMPGVTGVTVVQGMPFSSHNIPPMSVPGYAMPSPAVQQLPIMYAATPTYLDMMGVKLVAGRLFTSRDTTGTPLVVLVNETMARTMWADQSALGKCVKAGHAGGPEMGDPMAAAAFLPCREVVGVVRDSRARSLRTEGGEAKLMQYYVPFGQIPAAPFVGVNTVHAILVRTSAEPERMIAPVQRIIQSTSTVPVYARVRPYQTLIDPQLRSWRLGATLFTAFGVLALGIATVGLFAVVSYLVSQRTQEIGVRLALGGSARRVGGVVVKDAVRMASVGGVIGILVALAAGSLVQSMLFATSAREPAIMVAAALVMLGVTVGAAAVPAWRAGRVSPLTVLRG
ncbi:MAG TPA: ADOP family duplicated permease [Gemmatimonadaceae bacterium]|nr:ADOP family duplicated permease [Gemmatimonadaceae bacterium]